MLQRIALLAIAAPRRIIAVALLVMVGRGDLRHPGGQEPVGRRLPGPDLGVGAGHPAAGRQVRPGRHGAGHQRAPPDEGATVPAARAVGTDIAAQLQASPYVGEVTSAWTAPPQPPPALISKDGKTGLIVAGITGGENGAQKHAKALTDELVHDRDGVTVRAGGEAMIYVADQRPDRKRPAADGIHRDPAELPGAGLGVRRAAGRGAAAGGRRASRSSARWRCCARSRSSPTCRSSR